MHGTAPAQWNRVPLWRLSDRHQTSVLWGAPLCTDVLLARKGGPTGPWTGRPPRLRSTQPATQSCANPSGNNTDHATESVELYLHSLIHCNSAVPSYLGTGDLILRARETNRTEPIRSAEDDGHIPLESRPRVVSEWVSEWVSRYFLKYFHRNARMTSALSSMRYIPHANVLLQIMTQILKCLRGGGAR
jgi:hypothetical protein